MRTAASSFFLAVFALLGTTHATINSDSSRKAHDNASNVCAYEPNKIVTDACTSYSSLEDINAALSTQLRTLTSDTDFFSHYRLNLYNKKCPFWSDEDGMCGNIACAVNTLDNEQDIPLVWRAQELGKLQGPKAHHPAKIEQEARPSESPFIGELGSNVGESCVLEYDDECDERDYCIPEDESATAKGDYVSLVDNPERFTGYSGAGAHQVWDAIYRENCFAKPVQPSDSKAQAANDLLSVMKQHGRQAGVQSAIAHQNDESPFDNLEFDQECVEKRVFYRVVSGMHASISTHLCYEFLNQTTGAWGPNVECYKSRLYPYPERISNLYFNYAILLRAVAKLRRHLADYTFCSAEPAQNQHTKTSVVSLVDTINSYGNIFDEHIMFQGPDAAGLKDDFKNRFRNISRVMDCVGCDKCRLWGKLQTAGYGTALKVLFEFDEANPQNDPPLRRTELVALINTLDRVSHSLQAVRYFESAIDDEFDSLSVNSTIESPKESTKQPIKEKKPQPPQTISDIFWQEFGEVWMALKFVIRGWIEFPSTIYHIISFEGYRIWYSFIGMVPPERPWSFRFNSDRDEL